MAKAKYDKEKAVFLRQLGWSYTDIAEYLGCSESWCKSRLLAVEKSKELMYAVAKEAMLDYCIIEDEV